MGIYSAIFDFVSGQGRKKKQAKAILDRRLVKASTIQIDHRARAAREKIRRETEQINRRLQGVSRERIHLEESARLLALERARKAEVEKVRTAAARLQANPMARYLFQGEVVRGFRSSNVRAFWYDHRLQSMYVTYKDNSTYQYFHVNPEEAQSLFRAPSKGEWIWSVFRIRGTKLGHRKPYLLLISPPLTARGELGRKWERTDEAALAHAKKVARDSGQATPYDEIFRFERKRPQSHTGKRGATRYLTSPKD